MGLIEDIIKGPGRIAFLENVRSHPQILVGDAFFDTLARDIFAKIDAEEEYLITWNDDFKAVVGLYDQATSGDLPPEMRRPDPLEGSIMQKFQLALKLTDMPSLIKDFRLAAHTAQSGKSKEQCIGEFKDRVIKLYGQFKVKLPEIRPIPTLLAPSEPKLESIGTLGRNVNEFIPSGDRSDATSYYTANGNLYAASDENIPCLVEASGSEEANRCMHVYFPGERVETNHENLLEETTALSPLGSPQVPKLFSKEWWLTPEKGIATIGGAVATTVLLGWGVLLWKKWGQWRRRNVQQGKIYKRRLHARSWTVRE